MIVKVQITKHTTDKIGWKGWRALVYDETRRYRWEGPATKALVTIVKSCHRQKGDTTCVKVYLAAHLEGTELILDKEAPWQDW